MEEHLVIGRVDTDAMLDAVKLKALRNRFSKSVAPTGTFYNTSRAALLLKAFYDAQGDRVPPPDFQVAGPWVYSSDRDGKNTVLCVGCGVVGDGSTHANKCPCVCPGCNRTVCHGQYIACGGARGHMEDRGTRLQHIKDLTKPPPAMVMVDDNSEPV